MEDGTTAQLIAEHKRIVSDFDKAGKEMIRARYERIDKENLVETTRAEERTSILQEVDDRGAKVFSNLTAQDSELRRRLSKNAMFQLEEQKLNELKMKEDLCKHKLEVLKLERKGVMAQVLLFSSSSAHSELSILED